MISKSPLVRDIIVTLVFGLSTPWVWVAILGLFSAYIELPLLTKIAETSSSNLSKIFVSNYQLILGALGSVFAALLIAVPYGLLLLQRQMIFYLLFIILVVGTHIIEALIFYPKDKAYILFFLSSSPYWVFVVSAGIIVYCIAYIKESKNA